MDSSAKIITVFGATGKQGGSVVRSLLQNPGFRVRAVTRNPGSEASQDLASLGAEVVRANGFCGDEVRAAFQGSWGAFVNLNSDDEIFSDPNAPTEFDLGKIIVDAIASVGVPHLVFSSGPPCLDITKGKVNVKSMNMKFKIEQYAKSLNIFQTLVPICPGWFLENTLSKVFAPVLGGFPYFPDSEGYLTFRTPHWGGKQQVPWLSISDDFGDLVQGIFLDPERWNGHVVHAVSDFGSFEYYVDSFAAVTGEKARFDPILPNWEAFDTHGIEQLDDVKLLFGFTQETGGLYFEAKEGEKETASELKRATSIALGRTQEQQSLISVKDWFAARFGK